MYTCFLSLLSFKENNLSVNVSNIFRKILEYEYKFYRRNWTGYNSAIVLILRGLFSGCCTFQRILEKTFKDMGEAVSPQ